MKPTRHPAIASCRQTTPDPCRHRECRYHVRHADAPDSHRGGEDVCALDVAAKGEHSLEEVGSVLGISRQRVQQIEERAMEKLRKAARKLAA